MSQLSIVQPQQSQNSRNSTTEGLLALIAAPYEAKLRYHNSGETLLTTLKYLNNYITQCHQDAPKINELSTHIQHLNALENFISQKKNSLEIICLSILERIKSLTPQEKLMLPGGWTNDAGRHHIIYQFQREETHYTVSADYPLSYSKREGSSQKLVEYNFQIKQVYPLRGNISDEALKQLIEMLMIVQAPHLSSTHPSAKKFISSTFHAHLNKMMAYFSEDAQLTSTASSRASQSLSAQTCIDDMLKSYFDTQAKYQQFSIDYQTYAITCFVNEHADHLSFEQYHLIQTAIKHTLELIHSDGLFTDPSEKTKKLNPLFELHEQVNNLNPTAPAHSRHFPHLNVQLSFPPVFNTTSAPSTKRQAPEALELDRPLFRLNLTSSIFSELDRLKDAMSQEDHWYNITQIEQALLDLPLPQNDKPAFFDDPLFEDESQYQRIRSTLIWLQTIYNDAHKKLIGDHPIASQHIINLNFLALQDYFLRYHSQLNQKLHFNQQFAGLISKFLNTNLHSPYLTTQHAQLDQRFIALHALYQKQTGPNISTDLICHLRILQQYPELYEELKTLLLENENLLPEEIQYLQNHDLEAIYVFLNSTNLQQNEKWTPLYLEAERYWLIVDLATQTFARLLNQNILPLNRTQLMLITNKEKQSTSHWFVSPFLNLMDIASLSFGDKLTQLRYPVTGPIQKIFNADTLTTSLNTPINTLKKESNDIQLSSYNLPHSDIQQHSTTPEVRRFQYFEHLRNSPSLQILLTIKNLHSHASAQDQDQLDKNHQLLIEGNLFEPGLLQASLEADPTTLITNFNEAIRVGLKKCMIHNNKLSEHALFYIRLNFLFSRFATQITETHQSLLHDLIDKLNKYLSKDQDKPIEYSLHYYRWMTLIVLTETQHELSTAHLYEIIESHLYLQAKTNNPLDPHDFPTTVDSKRAQWFLKRFINAQINQIEHEKVEQIARDIIIDLPNTTLQIDVIAGLIFNEGKAYCAIPMSLLPYLKTLNLEHHSTCLQSLNEEKYELHESDGTITRFIKTSDATTYITERTFTLNEQQQWYRLTKLPSRNTQFPRIFLDQSFNAWVNTNAKQPSLILTQNWQPAYYQKKQQWFTWQHQQVILNAPILSTFESPHFIITVSQDKETWVSYEQYGIKLYKHTDNPYVLQDKPSFILNQMQSLPNLPTIPCLGFTDEITQKPYFFVPIRTFKFIYQDGFLPTTHTKHRDRNQPSRSIFNPTL